jgi:hypothetical protein
MAWFASSAADCQGAHRNRKGIGNERSSKAIEAAPQPRRSLRLGMNRHVACSRIQEAEASQDAARGGICEL